MSQEKLMSKEMYMLLRFAYETGFHDGVRCCNDEDLNNFDDIIYKYFELPVKE